MNKFSLIIPVYNVEKYLSPCIDSILSQTYADFEVILVDDGSKDSSPQICDAYAQNDKRVHVIHKENGGQGDARNVGLRHASGEYVFFIDSDDLLYNENVLSMISKKMGKCPDVIFHKHIKWYEKDNSYSACDYDYHISADGLSFSDILCELIQKGAYGNVGWNKVVRRELLVNNNIKFQTNISAEDNDWFYQVLMVMKSVELLDEVCYVYRQREGSVTHGKSEKLLQNLLWIIEKWSSIILKNNGEPGISVIRNDLSFQYCNAIIICSQMHTQKALYQKLSAYKYLLKNGNNPRANVFNKVSSVIGLRGLIVALRMYQKLKK